MKTEKVQKQIESIIPTPQQTVEHLDKKLEEAKRLYATANADQKYVLERLFPQLKESEDERIRKAIVLFFELQDDNTTYSFIPKKDILSWLEKQGTKKVEQSPAWSEEDERIRKELLGHCRKQADIYNTLHTAKEYCKVQSWVAWLENQREQKPTDEEMKTALRTEYEKGRADTIAEMQKPTECSEEDEQTYFKSVEALEDFGKFELADWLKEHKNQFLKPQNTWKPSDEQMGALLSKLHVLKGGGDKVQGILESLYYDLKKLKE